MNIEAEGALRWHVFEEQPRLGHAWDSLQRHELQMC